MGKFAFAKFLAEVVGDRSYAKPKCDETILMSKTGDLDPRSLIVFRTNYVEEARALTSRLSD